MLRTEFLLPFGIWRSGHLDDHRNRYITSQIPSIFHVRQNNFSLVFYYFCDFSMHFPLDQKKVVFFFGKWSYKMRPTEGNIMVDVSKCIAVIIPTSNNCVLINYVIKKQFNFCWQQHAIGRKFRSTDEKHDHWLYFASDKFDMELIKDIKQVLHVLVLYLPIPVFWALYDQQVFLFKWLASIPTLYIVWHTYVVGISMAVSSDQNGWQFRLHVRQTWSNRNRQSFADHSHYASVQQFDLSLLQEMRIVDSTPTNRNRWSAHWNIFRYLRNCRAQLGGIDFFIVSNSLSPYNLMFEHRQRILVFQHQGWPSWTLSTLCRAR